MLHFKKKCRKYRYYIFLFIVAFFLFLPLLWSRELTFSWAKFTEEWYKTILVYLGIGVLIILFTDKDKEMKKRELLDERGRIAQEIMQQTSYNDLVSSIYCFLDLTNDIYIQFGNEYLSEDEKFAKSEMEYYRKNSNIDNYEEYAVTLNNIKTKLRQRT